MARLPYYTDAILLACTNQAQNQDILSKIHFKITEKEYDRFFRHVFLQFGETYPMKVKTSVKSGIYMSLTLSGGKTSGPATDVPAKTASA